MFQKYIKRNGQDLLLCKLSMKLIKENPKLEFKTIGDFESQVVTRLNQIHPLIQYHAQVTEKYVVIKCQKCTIFSQWYKNGEGLEMRQFSEKYTQNQWKVKENVDINLVYYRSINQNHCPKVHTDIPQNLIEIIDLQCANQMVN